MNSLLKFFYHKWIDSGDKWYPILSVFYLTYECNFRCPYCSDGAGKPYYTLPKKTLSGNEVISLLKKIRSYTEYLVITGGEPLNYPELDYVMKNLKSQKFKEVILTTNGFDLDKHIDTLAESVTTLVVSIDSLNGKKADAFYGTGTGTLKKILSNLEAVVNLKKRK